MKRKPRGLHHFDPYKEERERRDHERAVDNQKWIEQVIRANKNRPPIQNEKHGLALRTHRTPLTLPTLRFCKKENDTQ